MTGGKAFPILVSGVSAALITRSPASLGTRNSVSRICFCSGCCDGKLGSDPQPSRDWDATWSPKVRMRMRTAQHS